VLVEQVDDVGAQLLQRVLGDLANLLGAAVESDDLVVLDLEAELGRDNDVVSEWSDGLARQRLV
jgi:hypothetical protein